MRRVSSSYRGAALLGAAICLTTLAGCIDQSSDGAVANGIGANTGAPVGTPSARAAATGPGATKPPSSTTNEDPLRQL